MFGAAAPTKVPTDTVIPFRFFDDTPLWRAFILYSMFVFDDVLDPQKLRDSLEALIQRDGWRKLGARLRLDAKGKLEYHFPAEFTADRPGLTFTHVTHDMLAAEHPVAALLPRPSLRPAAVCDPDQFRTLFQREGGPVKLNDYLNSDLPQLALHIVSFKDKTIVCLNWPHTLMDALGKRALLDAWILMLEGRADEVVSPPDSAIDPLANLGMNPEEPHKLTDQRLSMFGLAKYGASNILDFVRSQENRMVCVPASFIKKIREEALADLKRTSTNPNDDIFLSEGDVLCAWWTRVAISHLPHDSKRLVVLNNAYSLRKPLADDLLPAKIGPYISNAIGFLNVLIPVHEIFEKPLSYIASAIRDSIKKLGTRGQVETFASMWRESSAKLPPLFGKPNMHMITYSNWSIAKLFDTDFSAARVTRTGSKPCKPSYIQNNQFGLVLPNGFPIVGKDGEGNYWMSGYMNKGHWALIEEELAKIEPIP